MRRIVMVVFGLMALGGCNVVQPLDCLLGIERPGCQRDANGMYRYIYTSPLVPAPNSDAIPVGSISTYSSPPPPPQIVVVPASPRRPVQTNCYRSGDYANCTSY